MNKFTIDWKGKDVSRKVQSALPRILQDAGEVILDASNQKAPIDEGTLITTGRVTVDKDKVFIGYDTPYAIRQHEDMTLRHKNGREAKFLESALKEQAKRVQQYVADQLDKELR